MIRTRLLLALLPLSLAVLPLRAADPDAKGGPKVFQELKYRNIGPAAGGRTCRSCGVPGDPLVWYTATAGGGVWKSIDGGLDWKPIFDDQTLSSVGSIAVATSEPNTVYIGTGEGNIRGNVAAGDGIYKSVDGGKNWKHVWKQEGQIGQLIVHPTNAAIAYAAVLGKVFGPNPERGVYRTTDGGKSWKQVLAVNADTGAADVCFDPSNPNVLFAAMWQTRRKPWVYISGGPGSGLYVSRDAGDTWKRLGGDGIPEEKLHGLPEGIYGRIGVTVAPSDSRRVYALIEAEKGGLYRSDDGGDSWTLVNAGHYLRQRPWYFTTLTVNPINPDDIWCPTVRLLRSIDGGKTFKAVKGPHHGDHHDVWIDPKNPKRMIDSNDGGVDLSPNGGESWFAPLLPLSQFYHVRCDNRVPYRVMGNMQDVGTASGPSNSLTGEGILLSEWHPVGGGETGVAVPDPVDPNIVYAGEYGGYLSRFNLRTHQARNISVYPTNPSGHAAEELRFRFNWTAPILVSGQEPATVYYGGNVLFRTTDAGLNWAAISPDLTRNDKSKQKWSGGPITGDNVGTEYYGTVFALAESPRIKNVLWAGSDDGLVHVTRDGGKNWTNITKNIPGFPEWGTVSCIEASHFDDGGALVVVDAHRLDDPRPYLWKTTDFGVTWTRLGAKLPQEVHLHAVREDPKHKGLLFLGTERGVSFSTDGGTTWEELKLNLPTVGVTDLIVKDNDLVLSTNGRSLWIFDDVTPLRALTPKIADQHAHLFRVEPAIRWRYHSPNYSEGRKNTIGENPPKGVIINYFLKQKPKEPITLEVFDAQGTLVTNFDSREDKDQPAEDDPDAPEDHDKKLVLPTLPGVNRAAWNLRYRGAKAIKGAKVDSGDPEHGPLVLPGTYTLKLTVDGQVMEAKVKVDPDPRVTVPVAELEAQLKTTLAMRDDITRITEMVERLRSVRSQLSQRNDLLRDNAKAEPLVKQAKALLDKLDALEEKLHNPKAEVAYDILAQKGGARLYSQMIFLYESLLDSDGPVTQGMKEVYTEQTAELKKYAAELRTLLSEDLAKVNAQAKQLDVPGVIVPGEAKKP